MPKLNKEIHVAKKINFFTSLYHKIYESSNCYIIKDLDDFYKKQNFIKLNFNTENLLYQNCINSFFIYDSSNFLNLKTIYNKFLLSNPTQLISYEDWINKLKQYIPNIEIIPLGSDFFVNYKPNY